MIDIDPKYLDEVRRILSEHFPDAEVRVFGSRVTGNARRFSDIDIALVEPERIDPRRIEELKDALSESDIPYRVDVLDWNAVSESFRRVIGEDYEVLSYQV